VDPAVREDSPLIALNTQKTVSIVVVVVVRFLFNSPNFNSPNPIPNPNPNPIIEIRRIERTPVVQSHRVSKQKQASDLFIALLLDKKKIV